MGSDHKPPIKFAKWRANHFSECPAEFKHFHHTKRHVKSMHGGKGKVVKIAENWQTLKERQMECFPGRNSFLKAGGKLQIQVGLLMHMILWNSHSFTIFLIRPMWSSVLGRMGTLSHSCHLTWVEFMWFVCLPHCHFLAVYFLMHAQE